MFAYGCPYEDTRRAILSREVKESIVAFSGRSEHEIKAVARSLLGIFDILRKDCRVTAQTLANTDSLFTNAFPRFENLFVDVKKAFENRRNRLVERKCLADLFEKTRADEDYVWKPDEVPTLKDEVEINDASFLEAQPWYNGCRGTATGWTVKHDLVLLRGSLEVGYSPWIITKCNEQLKSLFYEKQFGSTFHENTSPPPPHDSLHVKNFIDIAKCRLRGMLSRMCGGTNAKIGHTSGGISMAIGNNLGAPKLQWTDVLKVKFCGAVEHLMNTNQRIAPNAIFYLMGEPDLTSKHVASYLQRVRKGSNLETLELSVRLNKYEERFSGGFMYRGAYHIGSNVQQQQQEFSGGFIYRGQYYMPGSKVQHAKTAAQEKRLYQQGVEAWNAQCDIEPTLSDKDKIKIPKHGTTDAYSKLCEEATTRLNEFYAQPMQPSVSKFRAASDIDCSDYEELYRSANLFQTWLVGFRDWLVTTQQKVPSIFFLFFEGV